MFNFDKYFTESVKNIEKKGKKSYYSEPFNEEIICIIDEHGQIWDKNNNLLTEKEAKSMLYKIDNFMLNKVLDEDVISGVSWDDFHKLDYQKK